MEAKPKPTEAIQLLRSILTELRGMRKDLRVRFQIKIEEEAKSMVKGALSTPEANATAQYMKSILDVVPPPSEELKASVKRRVGKIVGRDDF